MLVIIIFLLVIFSLYILYIKKLIMKVIIKRRMRKERYFLQYQPIYNPRNKEIVGFEALLRLTDQNKRMILPYKFRSQIEKSNRLFDVSIWTLKKVIRDYKKIKYISCINERSFYISINTTLEEIENNRFTKEIIKILHNANLGKGIICLEIVEKVRMNDIQKVKKNITRLKEAGFKIALDGFGVETSNLDIIIKLNFDIIKVHKHFIEDIHKDNIKKEIILFMSRISELKNKPIILAGIEEYNQHLIIEQIKNPLLYVQGDYYNKPMDIEYELNPICGT